MIHFLSMINLNGNFIFRDKIFFFQSRASRPEWAFLYSISCFETRSRKRTSSLKAFWELKVILNNSWECDQNLLLMLISMLRKVLASTWQQLDSTLKPFQNDICTHILSALSFGILTRLNAIIAVQAVYYDFLPRWGYWRPRGLKRCIPRHFRFFDQVFRILKQYCNILALAECQRC